MRRVLWHGNARRALDLVSDVEEDVLDVAEPGEPLEPGNAPPAVPPQARPRRASWRALGEFVPPWDWRRR